MTRSVALAAAVVGAAGSLLSATALPWAHYGDITVPLTRFPGWGGYVGSVLALHACVAWAVLGRTARPALTLAATAALSVVAIGSTLLLALTYDEASALFDGVVPAVMPGPGLGGIVAVVAILISSGAAAVSAAGHRTMATTPANALP
ncbi:hypothetical protein [Micromonospora chokoriensis]|uniref:Tryptophan-associated transmembrane protein (Trp_oprn_chp) n=1 Tax=Micromonospora chokoriensis TaxID=356851 RepID=A0A1C4VFQ4_9ACTN|nr:hypothetical protein [Micromonospora chokoriensis]SCE82814.1 hypothetical protein GA0070612_1386 [Micromonospora chokoriensis]